LNGELLFGGTTTDTALELDNASPRDATTADPEEPPALEVLDANDTTDAQNVTWTPRVTLQWRGSTDAHYYLVQESVDGAWVTRNYQLESGRGYYQYDSTALDDGESNDWRVVPYDLYDVAGSGLPYQFLVVRNPAPPRISMEYDQTTGNLTARARV